MMARQSDIHVRVRNRLACDFAISTLLYINTMSEKRGKTEDAKRKWAMQ